LLLLTLAPSSSPLCACWCMCKKDGQCVGVCEKECVRVDWGEKEV